MSETFQDEGGGRPLEKSRGFPPGTLILTGRGFKPVEEVAIGDMALDGSMRWRKVKEIFTGKGATRVLKGHGHPGLHVGEDTALYLRLRRCFKNARAGEPVDRDFSEPSWIRSGEIGDAHYWATPTRFQKLDIPRIRRMEDQYEIEADEDTLWLSGYLVGSGTPHGRGDGSPLRVVASADEARLETFMERIGRWPLIAKSFGVKLIPKPGAATIIRLYNAGFAQWTVENFGRLSGEKKIPAWLLGADRPLREQFLKGSHLSDGDVGRFEEASIRTTSKELAFGLRSLIESLGNSGIINARKSPRARAIATLYRVGWRLNPRNEHTEVRDGLRWMPIKSTSDGGGEQTLHDIALEGGGSCVAEGIIAATRA